MYNNKDYQEFVEICLGWFMKPEKSEYSDKIQVYGSPVLCLRAYEHQRLVSCMHTSRTMFDACFRHLCMTYVLYTVHALCITLYSVYLCMLCVLLMITSCLFERRSAVSPCVYSETLQLGQSWLILGWQALSAVTWPRKANILDC